jgi:hypothetical protein
MIVSAEAWILIGVGVLVVFFVLAEGWRRADRANSELRTVLGENTLRSKNLARDLSKESRARRRQAEEFANLRKRVEKTKRRAMKGEDLPLGTSARIRDHEAEVERVGLERDRANAERESLLSAVADLENQLATSVRALAAATVPTPPPVPTELDMEIAKVKDATAENQLKVGTLEDELALAHKTEARLRKRLSNQEILYTSIRAELGVKADRLRTQEEELQRLRALKVAVID